jgi:hypothetical protein
LKESCYDQLLISRRINGRCDLVNRPAFVEQAHLSEGER